MKRILVVEDEDKLRGVLVDFLESEGYEVRTATDGEQGLALAETLSPDLVLLDVMLPRKNGFDVCRLLRARGLQVPLLMLTAKGEESDKVLGLELGADDYLTKPFGLNELNARLRALLRRAEPQARPPADRFAVGAVAVDLKQYAVLQGERALPLSALEVKLLRYLLEHRGQVVTRDDLLNHVWGYENFPTTRTVDTHILNLRKKLEPDPERPVHLLTIHGAGYKLV